MTDGLRDEDDDCVLHLERDYDAAVEDVWDAWTDPRRLSRWLGAVTAPLGSDPVRMRFGDEPQDWADLTVVRSEPPRLLELRWAFAGEVVTALTVEIEAVAGDRTRVTLEHRRLGGSVGGYGAGWTAYLDDLGAEVGMSPPPGSWDDRFAAALPEWQRRVAQRTTSATG